MLCKISMPISIIINDVLWYASTIFEASNIHFVFDLYLILFLLLMKAVGLHSLLSLGLPYLMTKGVVCQSMKITTCFPSTLMFIAK